MSEEQKKQPIEAGKWPEQKPVVLPPAFYRTLIAIAQANALDKARAELAQANTPRPETPAREPRSRKTERKGTKVDSHRQTGPSPGSNAQ